MKNHDGFIGIPKALRPTRQDLTKEQEQMLVKAWQIGKSRLARERLVRALDHYALAIAVRLAKGNKNLVDDFFQEARLGIMKGVDRFELGRGGRLQEYCIWLMRSQIQDFARKNGRTIPFDTQSLNRPIARDSKLTAIDCLTSDRFHPEDELGILGFGDKEMLRRFLPRLTSRQRLVIYFRYFDPDPPLLKDLAKKMGVTRQRVSEIQRRALDRLKELIEEQQSKEGMKATG